MNTVPAPTVPAPSAKPGLFIAVPVYGGVEPLFLQCLMRFFGKPTVNCGIRTLAGDSLVSRARNTLTADFLETDFTDLLFIDSDLVFTPQHIARLMSHDADVVGGFYPKKQQGDVAWVCNALDTKSEIQPDGLIPVRYIGTGFLRVRRRVFERMAAECGDMIQYRADSTGRLEHDFWQVGAYRYPDGTARYLSEDWFFCQRWLDLGGKVFGDTKIVLSHVGQAVYPLATQLEKITETATVPADTVPATAPA